MAIEPTDKRGAYLYGSVLLIREECPNCGAIGFLKGGKSACCKAPVEVKKRYKVYRMSGSPNVRKQPGLKARHEILTLQQYECFYCGQPFNCKRKRNGKIVTLKINWDHFLPFSFSQNNYAYNFVAACHVCNGIKHSLHFKTALDAMVYLRMKRAAKGYDF